MFRKFFRHLILRGLILAFTGDQAASVFDEEPEKVERSAAATALQALDKQVGAGWQFALFPVTAYQVIRGSGL
jgi:hypothetical protein